MQKVLRLNFLIFLIFLGFSAPATSKDSNETKERKFPLHGDERSAPPSSQGSGGRQFNRCEQPIPRMTLFAPNNEVGTTTKSHPKFLFSLADLRGSKAIDSSTPFKMRYSIYEEESKELLVYSQFEVAQENSSLVALSLPDSLPGLEPGKKYVFTLGLVCLQEATMTDYAKRIVLERVSLAEGKDAWYDSIFEAFANKNSVDSSNLSQLLRQEGLFSPQALSAEMLFLTPESQLSSLRDLLNN